MVIVFARSSRLPVVVWLMPSNGLTTIVLLVSEIDPNRNTPDIVHVVLLSVRFGPAVGHGAAARGAASAPRAMAAIPIGRNMSTIVRAPLGSRGVAPGWSRPKIGHEIRSFVML